MDAVPGVVAPLLRAFAEWDFDLCDPRQELRRRRVDDPSVLPGYYYRDDILRMRDIIEDYVREMVGYYYPAGAQDVAQDSELQDWMREMKEVAGFRNLPGDGRLAGVDEIVTLMTRILFTVSAEHAAVNNGQYDYFGYVPNAPGALFCPPPRPDERVTETHLVAALPRLDSSATQTVIAGTLSRKTENPLGAYQPDFFNGDPAIWSMVRRFQDGLQSVSGAISQRNMSLPIPYPYLDPRQIAQSIEI